MTEMVEWLRGVVAGDLEVAKKAARLQLDPREWLGIDGRAIAPHIGVVHEVEAREHVATHDPRDVIADCDAKLEIIDLHSTDVSSPKRRENVCERDMEDMPCSTLRLLACGYRHRPGWKESWRP